MAPPDPGDPAPRVLLPRAAVARDILPDGLAAMGWQVDVVEAYRTVTATVDPAVVDVVRRANAVTFTSSSTVDRFVEALGPDALPPVAVCIGPVTAATARGHGIAGVVEADEHTLDGVLGALIDAIGSRSGSSTDESGSTGP